MSGSELLVVLVAALLLFGGKRMPELARKWGKTYRDLRRSYEEFKRQLQRELESPDDPPRPGSGSSPKAG